MKVLAPLLATFSMLAKRSNAVPFAAPTPAPTFPPHDSITLTFFDDTAGPKVNTLFDDTFGHTDDDVQQQQHYQHQHTDRIYREESSIFWSGRGQS